MIFAYFGPETMLPVTSVVATVVGLVMMFGRVALRLSTTAFRRAILRPFRAGALRPNLLRQSQVEGSVPATRN